MLLSSLFILFLSSAHADPMNFENCADTLSKLPNSGFNFLWDDDSLLRPGVIRQEKFSTKQPDTDLVGKTLGTTHYGESRESTITDYDKVIDLTKNSIVIEHKKKIKTLNLKIDEQKRPTIIEAKVTEGKIIKKAKYELDYDEKNNCFVKAVHDETIKPTLSLELKKCFPEAKPTDQYLKNCNYYFVNDLRKPNPFSAGMDPLTPPIKPASK